MQKDGQKVETHLNTSGNRGTNHTCSPPKAIQNQLFTKLIKQKQEFLGITHVYQEQPAWCGLLNHRSSKIMLNKCWLAKQGINKQSASLIPAKKRTEEDGYFKPPKDNYTLMAVHYSP